jgi:YgiT-type zinc finger domain-containing protein
MNNKCPLCEGKKTTGTTTYTVDLGFGVVVVRSVPAKVCSQCGEEWIDASVARSLENIVVSAKSKHSLVEVVAYQ